jgi:hypothetical protein
MLKSLQKVPRTTVFPKDCALPARARYVLGYLVFGIDSPIPNRPDIPVGKPLTVAQVSELLGVRRSYVRGWLADQTFKLEFAAALAQVRQGHAPTAISRIAELMASESEGVALRAAQAMLGEDVKAPAVSVTVNNQTNLAAQIRPGYIVRLPADLQVSRNAECPASHTRETLPAGDAESR